MASKNIFQRFVEAGRLAYVKYGPLVGKMVVIVDMIDLNRVVIDGPMSGVSRQEIPVKWLDLTSQRAVVGRGVKAKALKKALDKSGIMKKWAETKWAKKIASKKARDSMTDYDRFKVMLAKKKVGAVARREVKKVLKGKK